MYCPVVYAIVEARNLEEAKSLADLGALQSEQVIEIDPQFTANR